MNIDQQIRDLNFELIQPYCVVATVKGKRKAITGELPLAEAQERAWALEGDANYKRATFAKYPYKAKGTKTKPKYKK